MNHSLPFTRSGWRYYDVAVALFVASLLTANIISVKLIVTGNLLAVLAIWLTGLLPSPAFWQGQEAYDTILGFTPRLLLASFLAYLIGEFANSTILAKMKIWTQGHHLWARTIARHIGSLARDRDSGGGLDTVQRIGQESQDHLPEKMAEEV